VFSLSRGDHREWFRGTCFLDEPIGKLDDLDGADPREFPHIWFWFWIRPGAKTTKKKDQLEQANTFESMLPMFCCIICRDGRILESLAFSFPVLVVMGMKPGEVWGHSSLVGECRARPVFFRSWREPNPGQNTGIVPDNGIQSTYHS